MYATKADIDQVHTMFKHYADKQQLREISEKIDTFINKEDLDIIRFDMSTM